MGAAMKLSRWTTTASLVLIVELLSTSSQAGPADRAGMWVAERFGWTRVVRTPTTELSFGDRELALRALKGSREYDLVARRDALIDGSTSLAERILSRRGSSELFELGKLVQSKPPEPPSHFVRATAVNLDFKPWSPTQIDELLPALDAKLSERSMTLNPFNGKLKLGELAELETKYGKLKLEGETNLYVIIGGVGLGVYCMKSSCNKQALIEAVDDALGLKNIRRIVANDQTPSPVSLPPVNVP